LLLIFAPGWRSAGAPRRGRAVGHDAQSSEQALAVLEQTDHPEHQPDEAQERGRIE